ncbi:MAG: RusA family crossover junction endodeoxyribonuclease [Cyanobacteria bacterium J06554_6]
MDPNKPLLPFDFVIDCSRITPCSYNNKKAKGRWKQHVASTAREAWAGRSLLLMPVDATYTYFFRGHELDADNFVKHTQDAMTRVIWDDDRQVRSAAPRIRPLDGTFRLAGLTPVLAAAFVRNHPFVHVRINDHDSETL